MATCRERENGHFEFVVRRKRLLPKPIYLTFSSREAGEAYCDQLERMLDAGVVPDEFKQSTQSSNTLARLVRSYVAGHTPKSDDVAKLDLIVLEHGNLRLRDLDYRWAESFIAALKRNRHLSPGTVQKYAGALGRCLRWGVNKGIAPDNPIQRLPRGYAQYTSDDVKVAGVKKENVAREVRLPKGAEAAVHAAIAQKQTEVEAHHMLFDLALETAMRLREMYTLTVDQVDLDKRTIFLEKTKNGDKRQVPLSSVAHRLLTAYLETLDSEYLFPWWREGCARSLEQISSRVSKSFSRIFEMAGIPECTFHDLRHEATSRIFERTPLTDIQIAKITGHRDPRVLMRYANLRGSELAEKLW